MTFNEYLNTAISRIHLLLKKIKVSISYYGILYDYNKTIIVYECNVGYKYIEFQVNYAVRFQFIDSYPPI